MNVCNLLYDFTNKFYSHFSPKFLYFYTHILIHSHFNSHSPDDNPFQLKLCILQAYNYVLDFIYMGHRTAPHLFIHLYFLFYDHHLV